ncbi:NUDIX hydrolase [Myxococcota bacterium]|nr:NUDIX hydrolase [Myxococcota bacterium]
MKNYRNPVPTVDIIIECMSGEQSKIILIKRKNPPHGYALPGGFVDEGEPLHRAALREALEETGLTVTLTEQFHSYSDPSRDSRQHTVSTVFLGTASGEPVAGDDAAMVMLVDPGELPELVFDHRTIIEDWIRYRREGIRPAWNR